MTLPSLAGWLRCPKCSRALSALDTLVLGCENGHRFDANRRGFVSLLPSGSKVVGDGAAMLDARDAFLQAGWYQPILDALIGLAGLGLNDRPRIVDLGCGTGHYLRGLLEHAPLGEALACDLSPAAVARAVRRTGADGLVADVWQRLPIRNVAAEVMLNVFAPRNPAEFARMLSPGGILLCVVPTERHLSQLRRAGLALEVPADKAARVTADLGASFVREALDEVEFDMSLDGSHVSALLGMGPSAHHRNERDGDFDDARRTVTASVDVLRFRRIQSRASS